jgi:putative phosphoesterase
VSARGATVRVGVISDIIAVRGNNDREAWAEALPETATLRPGGVSIVVVHDLKTLPAAAVRGARVVVAGHSHQPRKEVRGGILYFNPGSAGPRRFRLPIAVGRLEIAAGRVRASLIDLGSPRAARRRDIIAP